LMAAPFLEAARYRACRFAPGLHSQPLIFLMAARSRLRFRAIALTLRAGNFGLVGIPM